MSKGITLLCTVETNKSGRWELTPLLNLPTVFSFSQPEFDVAGLGLYYKVRSGALQKKMNVLEFSDKHHQGVVVAYFEEKTNLVLKNIFPIQKGKEYKMSTTASADVKVKSVSHPTPVAVRRELEAISEVKGLFALVNITYAAVNQKSSPAKVAVTMDESIARRVADVLATNGALVEVVASGTDNVLYTPTGKVVEAKKPEVAKAAAVGKTVVEPGYFYVPQILSDISRVVSALSKLPDFRSVSMLISGPSGWGKTAFCEPLAKALGLTVEYFDMSIVLETEELYGNREIRNGDTEFEFNKFVAAVEAGNRVIVCDEINRTYAGALNSLFPLLDWRGKTTIHNREIKVGPRTVFVATRNVGSAYVGTQNSDGALISRFDFAAVVDAMPPAEEITLLVKRTGISKSDAGLIVKVANAIREQADSLGVNVSPRNTLSIAQMVAAGLHARAAYQWNVLLKESEAEVRMQLETLLNRHFGIQYGEAADKSQLPAVF